MESLKKLDVLEHNLKTLDSFVRKEFSKLMEYTPTELWNTQSAILNKINKQKKELQNLKERKMAQRANKQWQDGYCSAIDDFIGVQK